VTRIEFEGDLHRVAGARLYVGGAGRLFEIIGNELSSIDLPHSDSFPLAVDEEGCLILGRPSGDRIVRRYTSDGKLDATYGFTLDQILSLAVSGKDLIVAFRNGLVQRVDGQTVPRIDYSRKVGMISNQLDALDGRIAVAGESCTLFDNEGTVLHRLSGSKKIRLRREGVWLLDDSLQGNDRTILPKDLGLTSIRDVVCGGGTEWALGEALVQIDPH
jgi:hypothetical protein